MNLYSLSQSKFFNDKIVQNVFKDNLYLGMLEKCSVKSADYDKWRNWAKEDKTRVIPHGALRVMKYRCHFFIRSHQIEQTGWFDSELSAIEALIQLHQKLLNECQQN